MLRKSLICFAAASGLILMGGLSSAQDVNPDRTLERPQTYSPYVERAAANPSFAEGVPVVLMEAQASGKPVIATQVAGVGELVEDGVNGFIVPPGDMQRLSEAIRRLAGDSALCARMGAAGPDRVAADFDIATEAARLARLFAEGPGTGVRPSPRQEAPQEP